MPARMPPLLTVDQLNTFFHAAFPDRPTEDRIRVEWLEGDRIRVRMRIGPGDLRPGATISGPTMFTLVDSVAWLLTLAHLGEGRDAVTSSVTIHYLRRPGEADLVGEGRLLRMGRRSSVTDVLLFSEGADDPVVQATVTYAPV
jgi:uncharacterized protein (TIGR00369 family)